MEGWTPRERTELPAVYEFEELLEAVGEEWGFEPEVLFDAMPAGGVAFSDSSAYAIKLTDASGAISRIPSSARTAASGDRGTTAGRTATPSR